MSEAFVQCWQCILIVLGRARLGGLGWIGVPFRTRLCVWLLGVSV